MKIQTYKVDKYRDCPVYYRNFADTFEYLTVIKKELYTAHLRMKPTLFNRLLCLTGIERTNYSQQQQGMALKQLRKLAETTIDFVLDKKSDIIKK